MDVGIINIHLQKKLKWQFCYIWVNVQHDVGLWLCQKNGGPFYYVGCLFLHNAPVKIVYEA